MEKKVFIINGYPRAGKDTFADIISKYCKVRKYNGGVSYVRNIYR